MTATALTELQNALPLFLLVLVRATTLFMMLPIFGAGSVPPPVKIGFAFLLTIMILPMLKAGAPVIPTAWGGFLIALMSEIGTGLIIGFAASLIFEGANLAGELIGIQMGFGMAQVFNPAAERQVALIGQFYFLIASFVFFSLNGHHWLVAAFWRSFKHVPVGSLALSPVIIARIVELTSQIFLVAFILVIPIWGILALVDLVLAIISQSMPQLQVLFLGMPIKIGIGLLTIMVSLGLIGDYMRT
ncbi:MAG: flagellar biosynthetic protein FliR, partial [Candidatus Sericytochromatia bacterium]|nr:flagellar biosynthetic protein FliR [Candidatus Sericytochromatia bacterium]